MRCCPASEQEKKNPSVTEAHIGTDLEESFRLVRQLPPDPDHVIRCTSWELRSIGGVGMLEGWVTVVPRAFNSLFTQR
jgi:hypothetical protein